MDHQGHLYEETTPGSRGRDKSRSSKRNSSLDTPKRAGRQKRELSPKIEGPPESQKASRKIMSTQSSKGGLRLTEAPDRDSIDAGSSPTVAGRPQDSASKPRKSSFPEKLIYLPGSTAYIDMTSIPTKETSRAAIWIVQQLGHFFEHDDPLPSNVRRDRTLNANNTSGNSPLVSGSAAFGANAATPASNSVALASGSTAFGVDTSTTASNSVALTSSSTSLVSRSEAIGSSSAAFASHSTAPVSGSDASASGSTALTSNPVASNSGTIITPFGYESFLTRYWEPRSSIARPPVSKVFGPLWFDHEIADYTIIGPSKEPRRTSARQRQRKRIRYDDDAATIEAYIAGQDADEESAVEGDVQKMPENGIGKFPGSNAGKAPRNLPGQARKVNYDERPKTLSEKEIYRRNYAVEHDMYPKFLFKSESMQTIFRADDDTLSQKAFDLGTVLVKILQSTSVPSTLEEDALLLDEFTSAIKKTYNDHEALLDAFQRLAQLPPIQEVVVYYLRCLGKPEVAAFGVSDGVDEKVVHTRPTHAAGRPRGLDVIHPLKRPITEMVEEAWKALSVIKPYSTPYPNLTPIAEPSVTAEVLTTTESRTTVEPSATGESTKELDTAVTVQATSGLAAPQRSQNVLSESQIDDLLALAGSGSESDDEDNDANDSVEDTFRDVAISSVLHRYIVETKARSKPGTVQEDWSMLPFIMRLADPHFLMTSEERIAILQKKFVDFAALYVKPKVNTVMSADQGHALSSVYGFVASRIDPSPLLSIYENEGPHDSRLEVGSRGRLTTAEIDAIKEDAQMERDEKRRRKEQGLEYEESEEPKAATKDRPWRW